MSLFPKLYTATPVPKISIPADHFGSDARSRRGRPPRRTHSRDIRDIKEACIFAAGRDPSAPERLMVSFQGPCGQDPFEIFGEEGPALPIDIQHQPALLAAKSKAENLFHLEEAP